MSEYEKTQLTREKLYEGLSELSKHVECEDLVVIGSGAIAQFVVNNNDLAAKFSVTEDVDVCLTRDKNYPEKGEDHFDKGSEFHINNGFYIQLLDEFFFSNLESNWKARATLLKVKPGKTFYILSPIDVASNKLLVGRSKDFEMLCAMILDGFLDREELRVLQSNLLNEKPKLANQILMVNEGLDIRVDLSKSGFAEKVAAFADKYRNEAKAFDIILGMLGIDLPGDNPTPPGMEVAEKHFDDRKIGGKTLIERLEKFASIAMKQALRR